MVIGKGACCGKRIQDFPVASRLTIKDAAGKTNAL
jgi:hypothetical protein